LYIALVVVLMAFASMVTLPQSASHWMKVQLGQAIPSFVPRGTGVKSNRASSVVSIWLVILVRVGGAGRARRDWGGDFFWVISRKITDMLSYRKVVSE
jgi:hypothetical protein